MDKPLLPVVAGPTASGKTAIAVELCKLIGGEVVSADSMQVYKGMDVLSAMPTPVEMGGVPHHLQGLRHPGVHILRAAHGIIMTQLPIPHGRGNATALQRAGQQLADRSFHPL